MILSTITHDWGVDVPTETSVSIGLKAERATTLHPGTGRSPTGGKNDACPPGDGGGRAFIPLRRRGRTIPARPALDRTTEGVGAIAGGERGGPPCPGRAPKGEGLGRGRQPSLG